MNIEEMRGSPYTVTPHVPRSDPPNYLRVRLYGSVHSSYFSSFGMFWPCLFNKLLSNSCACRAWLGATFLGCCRYLMPHAVRRLTHVEKNARCPATLGESFPCPGSRENQILQGSDPPPVSKLLDFRYRLRAQEKMFSVDLEDSGLQI